MNAQELVSCPFCGSGSVALHPNDLAQDGGAMGLPGLGCFYAHCNGCGAEGPQCDDEAESIRAWNLRAPLLAAQPVGISPSLDEALNAACSDLSMLADGRDIGTREPLNLEDMRRIAGNACAALSSAWENATNPNRGTLAASPAPTKQAQTTEFVGADQVRGILKKGEPLP